MRPGTAVLKEFFWGSACHSQAIAAFFLSMEQVSPHFDVNGIDALAEA
jgi:hypothetical protein